MCTSYVCLTVACEISMIIVLLMRMGNSIMERLRDVMCIKRVEYRGIHDEVDS